MKWPSEACMFCKRQLCRLSPIMIGANKSQSKKMLQIITKPASLFKLILHM